MALKLKKLFGVILILLFSVLSASAKDIRFVQISEAKYSVQNKENNLDKVIKDINKQKNIAFVIFTGDNIERPSQENLAAFVSAAKMS